MYIEFRQIFDRERPVDWADDSDLRNRSDGRDWRTGPKIATPGPRATR